ncbi:MAG: hypothetical protein Hyperionvirus1_76 [Hyperionvirus sp.]|uniref:Uncharacterized protein n=1 Tax=Hyperionvirus sp. TaxID=2487770 RepID=A0A3G5A5I6_9VIRU|nr:MAG: hypothetical protein Hyperionvirus1_76 [Hyperionvirus sp.]
MTSDLIDICFLLSSTSDVDNLLINILDQLPLECLNTVDHNKKTILINCTISNKLKAAEFLLSNGCDINLMDSDFKTAVSYAHESKREDFIALFSNYIDLKYPTISEINMLKRVMKNDDIHAFDKISRNIMNRGISISVKGGGSDMDDTESYYITSPLQDLVSQTEVKNTEYFLKGLLESKCSLDDSTPNSHHNILQLAIISNQPEHILETLISAGVDINDHGSSNTVTPYGLALNQRNLTAIKILRKKSNRLTSLKSFMDIKELELLVFDIKKPNDQGKTNEILEYLINDDHEFINKCIDRGLLEFVEGALMKDLNFVHTYKDRVGYIKHILGRHYWHMHGTKMDVWFMARNFRYEIDINTRQLDPGFIERKIRSEDYMVGIIIESVIAKGRMDFLEEDYSFVLPAEFEGMCDRNVDFLDDYFFRNQDLFIKIQSMYIESIQLGLEGTNITAMNKKNCSYIVHMIMSYIY